jgi:uncharacterized phiE125 gp8 family phage protein
MTIRIVTAPTETPVTLEEAKEHCRVDLDVDDAVLTRHIGAAARWAEGYLQRPIVTQTRELLLDAFPACAIELRDGPVTTVESVKYIDANGVNQELGDMQLDLFSDPARILPGWGSSWPGTRDALNAVVVRYTAGYGAAADVPDDIKSAILLVVADLYEHREDSIDGVPVTEVPNSARNLLGLLRSYSS